MPDQLAHSVVVADGPTDLLMANETKAQPEHLQLSSLRWFDGRSSCLSVDDDDRELLLFCCRDASLLIITGVVVVVFCCLVVVF